MQFSENKNYLNEIAKAEEVYNKLERSVYQDIPPLGYWIPMLVCVAEQTANKIVEGSQGTGVADHNANFSSLLRAIEKSMFYRKEKFTPVLDNLIAPDKRAEDTLLYEFNRIRILHDKVSAQEELWDIGIDLSQIYDIRLSQPIRRTALHLLSEKAKYLSYSDDLKALIKIPPTFENLLASALHSRLNDLGPIKYGTPKEWAKFLESMKLNEESIVLYWCLVPYMSNITAQIWFEESTLIEVMGKLNVEWNITKTIDNDTYKNIIAQLIPTLDEAIDWGISVPFVRFNNWYMRWPFAFSVIHPNLTLLAILMKRNPVSWNNTVGSQAAKVSNYVISQLDKFDHIKMATCRIKKGIGDIDVALYNIKTKELLICEVKTVFDRFRTNHQHKNFSAQRVNYTKAAHQLTLIEESILNDSWDIRDIFNIREAHQPKKIYKIVLTWWDIYDSYKNTCFSDIAVSNFSLFFYLFNDARGDLSVVHRSLLELSTLACPAIKEYEELSLKDISLKWTIEKQTILLPPPQNSRREYLSDFSKNLINDIASFPDDWEKQLEEIDVDAPKYYIFYD